MSIVPASQSVYLTKLSTLGILFLTAVTTAVVVKPVIVVILPSIPVFLAL